MLAAGTATRTKGRSRSRPFSLQTRREHDREPAHQALALGVTFATRNGARSRSGATNAQTRCQVRGYETSVVGVSLELVSERKFPEGGGSSSCARADGWPGVRRRRIARPPRISQPVGTGPAGALKLSRHGEGTEAVLPEPHRHTRRRREKLRKNGAHSCRACWKNDTPFAACKSGGRGPAGCGQLRFLSERVSAARVAGPRIPSAVSLLARWKLARACVVAEPYWPSILPGE